MRYLGDFEPGATIYGKFNSYQPSTGAIFALAGSPAIAVYKDDGTTESTAGATITASFDARTGLNHVSIDTSADGTFYSDGAQFDVVLTAGTIDGVSVVGSVVASFSLRKCAALKPTTAGRTLDVSAGGEAGLDWANIGSPTTAQTLSDTTVGTATTIGATGLAAINAEVVDCLNVDTYAEPTGAPPATASLVRKIGQLYMLHRNRVDVTSSAFTVFDDGNAAEYSKALTDNGTTYSEAEAV